MDEFQPTTRQLVIFTVVLSFIVSVIGTVLTSGILGPLLSSGDGSGGGPLVFNRPKILEKITEKVTTSEILRQDELVVKVVERSSPAVVSVVASKDVPVVERFFIDPLEGDPFFKKFFEDDPVLQVPQFKQKGTQKKEISSGTAFIISSDGLILTNKHVVSDIEAEYMVLMNDGKKKLARVLARDPVEDLAVLKIEGSDFTTLTFGDSSKIKIGQSVIAIGNTLGEFRNTVSLGVVSGLQRSIVAEGPSGASEFLQELIQTDAAINRGNSGGPLLNIYGEVIGINTAVARGAENVGFAIPINKAKRDIENVKKFGKIIYPFLGIRYVMITKEIVDKEKLGYGQGALIVGSESDPAIVPGSPAERAGLKKGDIVFEINGEKIDSTHSLASLLQKYNVGDEIRLKIFRENKEIEFAAKLDERK